MNITQTNGEEQKERENLSEKLHDENIFLLAAAAAAAATLPDRLQVLKVPVNLDWLLFKYPNFKAH